MTHNKIPSRSEILKQTLNSRRYIDNDLFREDNQTPYFWKLSDLAILYPNFFDVKKPVSAREIKRINTTITNAIPEFRNLTEKPIHILNTKESYNICVPQTNKIKTIKHGNNQHLTGIACEYLFGKFKGTELEQAYFLYPTKDAHELEIAAQDLKFEKIRNQISQTSNLLSSIINRAYGADKSSFSKVWSFIWEKLYNVKSMDELRQKYNIKTSPIDYMRPQTLIFINAMLQEIVLTFTNTPSYSINDIYNLISIKTALARRKFFEYGSSPEKQLTERGTYSIIKKIRNARKKLWLANYPVSLQVR